MEQSVPLFHCSTVLLFQSRPTPLQGRHTLIFTACASPVRAEVVGVASGKCQGFQRKSKKTVETNALSGGARGHG
jgi:hypothetical protein